MKLLGFNACNNIVLILVLGKVSTNVIALPPLDVTSVGFAPKVNSVLTVFTCCAVHAANSAVKPIDVS